MWARSRGARTSSIASLPWRADLLGHARAGVLDGEQVRAGVSAKHRAMPILERLCWTEGPTVAARALVPDVGDHGAAMWPLLSRIKCSRDELCREDILFRDGAERVRRRRAVSHLGARHVPEGFPGHGLWIQHSNPPLVSLIDGSDEFGSRRGKKTVGVIGFHTPERCMGE